MADGSPQFPPEFRSWEGCAAALALVRSQFCHPAGISPLCDRLASRFSPGAWPHGYSTGEREREAAAWSEEDQKWYFSVIDVIEALTGTDRPRKYWNDLKTKLHKEGSRLSEKIGQLKMAAADGKKYATDVADTEQLLRLIQSVPSPKAEPFKQWLARVGYERMQEIADPEQSLDRAREHWKQLGRSEKWIQQRMSGQDTRNKLTDYWKEHGVEKSDEFALLTNIIHQDFVQTTMDKATSIQLFEAKQIRGWILLPTNQHRSTPAPIAAPAKPLHASPLLRHKKNNVCPPHRTFARHHPPFNAGE